MAKSKKELHKLHPIESLGNAPVAEGELRIERIESRLHPKVPFPHKHDFYHFLFIEKGSGWHEIDFERFKVGAGQFFLMRPAQVHAWNLNSSTRGLVLEFTMASLQNSPHKQNVLESLETLPLMLEGKEAQKFLPVLKLLFEEFQARAPGHTFVMQHLLEALLIQLQRVHAGNLRENRKLNSMSVKFRELVERHFMKEHSVEYYAKALHTNTKALTTYVQRALGKSAGGVIQERCLLEAKRFLVYSDFSIREIGYKLGYEDSNYFARFFRSKTGMSPGRFRKLATHSISLQR